MEDVGLSFGGKTIVDGLGLRLGESDRVGLIGPNGSGKTTLLRILAHQQEPDRGSITFARNTRVGYLPQELAVEGGKSLLDFVQSSVPGRTQLDEELMAAEADIAAAQGSKAVEAELLDAAQRIADLHERIDHFEQFFSEHEALRILAGLGFAEGDKTRDLAEFSGGWKMRAVLAALLFQQPDVLLLDEPTNHLDMPSVGWFAEFLKRYKRCFILISHDREFLNEQIARVVSFEPEGIKQFSGNYEQYIAHREEEEAVLEAKAKNLAREKEHMQKFVDRFRAKASKAKAVQSRVRALEKLDDVETFQRRSVMRFRLPPTDRCAGEVVRIEGLRKAYGERVVFPQLDLGVQRGEKIGIIGVNGAGKTTLLKMIAGELQPDSGAIRFGSGAQVGYYAQHHADTLHPKETIYQAVAQVAGDAPPARIRSILGAFLFSGDDVEKPIAVLSGGERARVALARLMLKPGNVVLMDEPTNHLDLESSESLADSLTTFDGTLIFVSHNRSLIRKLATRIWNVEAGGVETYPGTLDEYLYSCALRAAGTEPAATSSKTAEPAKKRTREDEKSRKRREAELRKRRSQKIGPVQKRVTELEQRIAALESEQAGRSKLLSDPAVYADAPRRDELLGAFQRDQVKLEELTTRWEAAAEELETLESELAAEEAALEMS